MKSRKTKIGLRVLSNPSWMGGINYVLNWVKALNLLPEEEKPEIYLLYFDKEGLHIAQEHAHLVTAFKPFSESHLLDLDIVYPVTQLFEAPFGAPWAGWIPDWQCNYFPEMFDEVEIARRGLHYHILATKAPYLILSSQMAFDDTVRIVGKDLVPMVKLPFPAVIEEKTFRTDSEEIARTLTKFGIPSRFFLVCNQFWKHKNHFLVFKALAKLSDPSINCVFTGDTTDHRWPEHFKRVEKFISENGLSSSVRLLGRISREDQLKLMMASVAIIQPSRFEGWSTVVEESKAMNKTLLLSRFPVHIEQTPNGSYFFDLDDEEELAVLIKKIWESQTSQSAKELTQKHLRRQEDYIINCARRFVWIAQQTRKEYKQEIHDPTFILIDLLTNLNRKGNKVQEQINQRVFAGTRMMLRNQPEQIVKFVETVYKHKPDFLKTINNEILSSVLFKMSGEDRNFYLDKINEITNGQSVKFSFLRGIQNLIKPLVYKWK